MSMDKIFIHELKIETIIGVLPHERITKQPILITLEITTDIRKAAETDDLNDAVDYTMIAQRLDEFISHNHFQLLETLAEKIAELLFNEFNIFQLRLQIAKPNALANAKQVGLILERSRVKSLNQGRTYTCSL